MNKGFMGLERHGLDISCSAKNYSKNSLGMVYMPLNKNETCN